MNCHSARFMCVPTVHLLVVGLCGSSPPNIKITSTHILDNIFYCGKYAENNLSNHLTSVVLYAPVVPAVIHSGPVSAGVSQLACGV